MATGSCVWQMHVSLPAIALGLEPHSKEVMKEKPRPMNESILTKQFLIDVGIEGFVIALMTMLDRKSVV